MELNLKNKWLIDIENDIFLNKHNVYTNLDEFALDID